MRGVNKVILLEQWARSEVRSLGQSGSTVTSISLATSEAWKDKIRVNLPNKPNGIV